MILAVPYFPGPHADALLLRWERAMREHTRLPACVLVDGDYHVPGNLIPVRVDTTPFADCIRPSQPFDRKGAIVAAALAVLPEFCAMDADCIIQRDPAPELANLSRFSIASREDSWRREIPGMPNVVQRQAGVMVFGRSDERGPMAGFYRNFWHEMHKHDANDPWCEQMAWSAVYWIAEHRYELPQTLNYSWHQPGAENAHIRHEHGPGKWQRLGIA
jgi:hypothetical protein